MDKSNKSNKSNKLNKKNIVDYIGLKWGLGETGPTHYDCHGLVIEIQKEFYGNELPSVEVNAKSILDVIRKMSKHKIWEKFEKIQKPEDGCIVKIFTVEQPNHVGVYIDHPESGIIHSIRKHGVIFDSLFSLKRTYNKLEFYKFIKDK